MVEGTAWKRSSSTSRPQHASSALLRGDATYSLLPSRDQEGSPLCLPLRASLITRASPFSHHLRFPPSLLPVADQPFTFFLLSQKLPFTSTTIRLTPLKLLLLLVTSTFLAQLLPSIPAWLTCSSPLLRSSSQFSPSPHLLHSPSPYRFQATKPSLPY